VNTKLVMSRSGLYLAVVLALGSTIAFPNPARAESCDPDDSPKLYKRCMEYFMMAGTPTQRKSALARWDAFKHPHRNCHYDRKQRETVCLISTP